MPGISINTQETLIAQGRVQMLYGRLPASIVSNLVGVFLIFVLLLDTANAEIARGWTAYMLSVLGYRSWLWYVFSATSLAVSSPRKWHTGFVVGTLLMGLGWAALTGPIFPAASAQAQYVVLLGAVVVVFASTVFLGPSHAAFWSLTLPTILPAIYQFLGLFGTGNLYSWAISIAVLGVLATTQISLRRTLMDNLRRRLVSEALLEEQQAIFQSAGIGIAVVQEGHIVKSNDRLGTLLGYRGEALLLQPLSGHFADRKEFEHFAREEQAARSEGRKCHGAFRLRRADGREFWAEISAQAMQGVDPGRSVWIINEVPLRPTPATQ